MTILDNSCIVCNIISIRRKQFLPNSGGSRISPEGGASTYYLENILLKTA